MLSGYTMGEHRTSRISKPKRFTVLVLLGLLVAGFGVHVYFRFCLTGFYYDPYMACDCSYIFKDGQIFIETEAGRDHLGAFKRVGGGWVCPGLPSSEPGGVYLESSLLDVTWFDKGFQSGVHFVPRSSLGSIAEFLHRFYIRI